MLKVVGASWTQTRLSSWIIGVVIVLGIIAIIVSETGRVNDDGNYSATVYWDRSDGAYDIEYWGQGKQMEEVDPGVARAHYDPHLQETGWAFFQVETQEKYPDDVQAFAAGFLEGALSWQMIYWHWKNTVSSYCDTQLNLCKNVRMFLNNNWEWVVAEAKKRNDEPYWHQVNLFYVQLEGIKRGFQEGVKRSRQDVEEIPHVDFLWMNSFSDLQDIIDKLSAPGTVKRWAYYSSSDSQHPSNTFGDPYIRGLDPDADVDCGYKGIPLSSAFIKFVPQREKLLVAHNSAGSYSQMLKIFKRYEFRFHETNQTASTLIPGTKLSLSSYPAAIHSMDDFYVVTGRGGHNLALTATPITVFNDDLWHLVNAKHQVLMGPRSLAANRMATNPETWASAFTQYNSGTGNKAWAIVDVGLFEKASAMRQNNKRYSPENLHNLFWVLEQLPGNVVATDQTELLLNKTYWAAYGIPFHTQIFQLSGTEKMLKQHGPVFSYEQTALANIFRRDHHNVTDMQTALKLMRSNLYKVDPLSEGNPRCAVGSRGDVGVTDPAEPVGVTDIKVLRSSPPLVQFVPVRNNTARMHVNYPKLYISAGPVYNGADTEGDEDDLEPFSWSAGNFSTVPHSGQPDTWMFKPIPVNFV